MRAPASLLLHRTAAAVRTTGETSSTPVQQAAPVGMAVDSNMVVILASLICALVCVLGLALVSRCACRRRARTSSSSDHCPAPPKGMKKKAIDALPKVSFAGASPAESATAWSSSSECAICLAEFTHGESVRVLPRCGHGFHVLCVDAWLRTHATCPSCRAAIVALEPAPPTVVVVVAPAAGGSRCGRCGELADPAGACSGGGDAMVLP